MQTNFTTVIKSDGHKRKFSKECMVIIWSQNNIRNIRSIEWWGWKEIKQAILVMDAGRLKMSTEQLAKITENIWRRKTARWPTLNLYGIIVLSLWGARCPLICYRRPNCPVRSIWGATILQDRSIWVFEVQLFCEITVFEYLRDNYIGRPNKLDLNAPFQLL